MSTFLSELRGFTPLIDIVAEDVGMVGAVVYGVVWRYCQMSDGVCRAAIGTISARSHMSRRTAQRALRVLEESGYIQDMGTLGVGGTHVYRDTGEVKIRGITEVTDREGGVSESPGGVSESPTKIDSMKKAFKIHDKRCDWKEEEEKQPGLDGLEWEMCKGDLRLQMLRATFDTWLKPTFGYRDGDVMVVEAHNPYAYEWLSIRLQGMIERTVESVCGKGVGVRIQEAP